MHFLEAHLLAGPGASGMRELGAARLLPLWPRKRLHGDGKRRRLTFWFDIASPFSYFAWSQLERVQRETGCEIELRPIFLGMLFKKYACPPAPGARG